MTTKRISFVAKAAKFGSQKRGDKRAFIIPKKKLIDILKLIGDDDARIVVEKVE